LALLNGEVKKKIATRKFEIIFVASPTSALYAILFCPAHLQVRLFEKKI
jgi:hypothetical protein